MAKEGVGFKVNSMLVFVAGCILVDEVSQGLLPSLRQWRDLLGAGGPDSTLLSPSRYGSCLARYRAGAALLSSYGIPERCLML